MEKVYANIIHVAVGVIKNSQGYFLTKRHQHSHQGGKWEFPGGKVEANESVLSALYRELKEEVGIEVVSSEPLTQISHDYGDRKVLLDVYLVDKFNGHCRALEGQQGAWFSLSAFDDLNFPKANKAIVELLKSR